MSSSSVVVGVPKLGLHSVPRSGSSWLGEILNSHPSISYSYQPLFSYAFKSVLDEGSDADDIRQFFSDIESTDDAFLNQTEARIQGIKPQFQKSGSCKLIAYKEVRYHYVLDNMLRNVPEFKLVALTRCPLAVLNSFKNAPREFRADLGWDFEKEWRFAQSKNDNRREDYFGYEKWKETALLFHELKRLFPEQVILVNYNRLIEDTSEQVRKLFTFLQLDMSEQTHTFLNEGSQQAVSGKTYSVFNNRTKDVAWQGHLSDSIVSYIRNDLKASRLPEYLSVHD